LTLLVAVQAASAGAISVVPQPVKIEAQEGVFRLSPDTTIVADKDAVEVAEYARELFAPATGLPLPIERLSDPKPHRANRITLKVNPDRNDLGKEGYALSVRGDGVTIQGATPTGVFYGVQTLRQLLPPAIERAKPSTDATAWEAPCVEIIDQPRFPWRGFMLDCSRTFWKKDFVKRLIGQMALYKLNVLHLHLTDDQGWRLEIKKYPKLTEAGAKFAARYHQPPEYEGYYTQDDIKEILACAARHHVTVVPEIEMPGHSKAMLTCYPELSCAGGPFEIYPYGKGPGIQKDICCAGNEKTFEFFEDVLTEVAELFPGELIHVGGDEAPKDRWKACPKCQTRIKKEGLKNERELQSYFIKRIEKFVNAKGKRLIGWDEILEGGLAPAATVMSWRGTRGGIIAARSGHDVVMTPKMIYYFNYRRLPTMGVYASDPVPKELNPEQARHVLGAQACFWSHSVREQDGFDACLFPRVMALAETTWTPKESLDAKQFRSRVQDQFKRLRELDIKYYDDTAPVKKKRRPT
ncbi:MAG TPA: beta-N-acetylhexosaminidase, partial [Thermoguttaceae bacterium]|nr:beta-N-acetylhexosaminidase [Thermoguttaceae bacterium]